MNLKTKILIIVIFIYYGFSISTVYCMEDVFYFNGTYYANFDSLIRAKQNYFFQALVSEDSSGLSRDYYTIKNYFYEVLSYYSPNINQQSLREDFNYLLNKQNSVEDIKNLASLVYNKYLKY